MSMESPWGRCFHRSGAGGKSTLGKEVWVVGGDGSVGEEEGPVGVGMEEERVKNRTRGTPSFKGLLEERELVKESYRVNRR